MNPRANPNNSDALNNIGTLQESSLHAALKTWYTQPGDRLEVPVDEYIVDIVRGDLLIEIQTRNFSALKKKLNTLTRDHAVRLVHPIAKEKWILRLPSEQDAPPKRRKSPKRGRLEHIFVELIRIPHLVAHPNFSLEVLLTQEEETRRNDGQGSWRRKGWSIVDHTLIRVDECIVLESPSDFSALIPPSLPHPFTSQDLGIALGIPRSLAQKMVYCLKKMGVLEVVSKRGRSYLYDRA